MSVYERRAPFRPWDDRTKANLLETAEEARRVITFAWIERRLGEVLREIAGDAPAPIADVLNRQAGHADWHATVWEQHLLPADAKATPGKLPTDGASLQQVHDLFDQVTAGPDLLEKLAGLSRVVWPRVIAAYSFHRTAIGTAGDPDAGRWLDIILDDAHDARRNLELFVQSLVTSPAEAERVGKVTARLETPLVTAGGLLGPGTLGTV